MRATSRVVLSLALIAGTLTLADSALASSGDATLTISASAPSAVTGSAVTVSGTLTSDGEPVASSPISLTIDSADGTSSTQQVSTDSAGSYSLPVTVVFDTTVSAAAEAVPSNQPSLQVSAVATASLKLATSVSGPYVLDPATVTTAPAGYTSYTLQVQLPGATKWQRAPDTSGVWGSKPETIAVRAVASGSGLVKAGVSSSVTVVIGDGRVPAWIRELNSYRALNDAPPVAADAALSHGDALHVRYMEKTNDFTHYENPKSRWYTKLGAEAGESSDLALDEWDPIRAWAGAPYHALSELSKTATLAGYATGGGYAALWLDGQTSLLVAHQPDVQFPANGKKTSLLAYSGGEIPNPLSSCPKAWRRRDDNLEEVGLPIIFGNRREVSRPSATVTSRGMRLRVCVVNDYSVVFVIPLLPLAAHRAYTVTVNYRHVRQSRWRFRTS